MSAVLANTYLTPVCVSHAYFLINELSYCMDFHLMVTIFLLFWINSAFPLSKFTTAIDSSFELIIHIEMQEGLF